MICKKKVKKIMNSTMCKCSTLNELAYEKMIENYNNYSNMIKFFMFQFADKYKKNVTIEIQIIFVLVGILVCVIFYLMHLMHINKQLLEHIKAQKVFECCADGKWIQSSDYKKCIDLYSSYCYTLYYCDENFNLVYENHDPGQSDSEEESEEEESEEEYASETGEEESEKGDSDYVPEESDEDQEDQEEEQRITKYFYKQNSWEKKEEPKRPSNAYIFFTIDIRKSIIDANPKLSNTGIVSLMAKMWKEMKLEDRLKYENKATEDKIRYKREMAAM